MDKLQTSQFDSLMKFSGDIKIGAFNSTFTSRIHSFDRTQRTLLVRFKIYTQTLEMIWLKAIRAICSSLIFPYSLVTVKALDTYWSWILKNLMYSKGILCTVREKRNRVSIRKLTKNIISRPEIFFFILFCTQNSAGDIFLNQVNNLINIQNSIFEKLRDF